MHRAKRLVISFQAGSSLVNDVDPKAWLADILARIADLPASRLHELLLWEWKLLRQADKPAGQQAA